MANQFLAQAERLERQADIATANWMLGILAAVLGDAGPAIQRFEKARDLYAAMYARDMACMVEVSLVYLPVGRRDVNQSRDLVQRSLQRASEQHSFMLVLPTLLAAAVLRIEQGLTAHAVELYEVASQHGMVANSKYYADTVGRRVTEAARALPPQERAAAQARGREGELWDTAEALLAEFEHGES